MKHVKDLMKEMGFREDADQGAKEAFLKHLIKAAYGTQVETPTEKRARRSKEWMQSARTQPGVEKSNKEDAPEQLSFDFSKTDGGKKVV